MALGPGPGYSPAGGVDTAGQAPAVRPAVRAPHARLVLRRFLRSRTAVAGLAVLAALFALAYLVPLFYPWSYRELDPAALLSPPSRRHWFGTDRAGADVFALTLRGLQKSLVIGLVVAAVCTVLAALAGTWAGYRGGRPAAVLMRIIDLLLVLPAFLIVAVLSPARRGTSWLLLALLLAAFSWMITARAVRATALTVRGREFVLAAAYAGVPTRAIILRHIAPAAASLLLIDAVIQVEAAILGEAGLSYLGFGIQLPDVSLGTVIAAGTPAVASFPWLFYGPAACLTLTALSAAVIGDGLRDALDPGATRARTRLPRRGPDAEQQGGTTPLLPSAVPASERPAGVPLLEVDHLQVTFPGETGPVHAVRGLSCTLHPGEALAVVGESGSGKSAAALAVLGLLPAGTRVHGAVRLRGRDLLALNDRGLSAVRGDEIAIVFQDSQSAFTPVKRLGDQLAEALRAHQALDRATARRAALDLLRRYGTPDPERVYAAYPEQLSGGMRQRAMIAMAAANHPDVIIADEPTAALDVTVQAEVLDTLRTARETAGAALVLITHDLGVAARVADRVQVMYAGRTVESGPADEIFHQPRMPYTIGLLAAAPRPGTRRLPTPLRGAPPGMAALPAGCPFAPRCPIATGLCHSVEPALAVPAHGTHESACHRSDELCTGALDPRSLYPPSPTPPPPGPGRPPGRPAVLEVRDLVRHFPVTTGRGLRRAPRPLRAVDGISLTLHQGQALALVGESGCGKTTALREILDFDRDRPGTVTVLGSDPRDLDRRSRRELHRGVQAVFQDPTAGLDAHLPVGASLAEPLKAAHWPKDRIPARVAELLTLVHLGTEHVHRFPRELSTGQRQRVGIARALAPQPRILLLDEPVSALDASVRAGVLGLLRDLKQRLSLSYLLVAHDLSLLGHIADRIAVMHGGQIVETGDADPVLTRPLHPYTRALISAVPVPDPRVERHRRRIPLPGEQAVALVRPPGCPFRSRCPLYPTLAGREQLRCRDEPPVLREHAPGRRAACHYALRPLPSTPPDAQPS